MTSACRSECMRGCDDLVARADPDRLDRQMQSGSSGVYRQCMDIASEKRGKVALELSSNGSRCDPPRTQRLDDGLDLFLANVR